MSTKDYNARTAHLAPEGAYQVLSRAQALEALDTNAAIADWNALLNLPQGAASSDWLDLARQHVASLSTSLPPPTAVTPTP